MNRRDYPHRIVKKGEVEKDPFLEATTSQERLLMM